MNKNIIENKSFDFAVRIVNLYKHLTIDKKEFISMEKDINEILSILIAICKKTNQNREFY